MFEEIVGLINSEVPNAKAVYNKAEVGDSSISVESKLILEVCQALKNSKKFEFNVLQAVSPVDYLPQAAVEGKPAAEGQEAVPGQPAQDGYIEVCYILASFTKNLELILKTKLPRGSVDNLPKINSVCSLWSAANFQEREAFDMMGIDFIGHPDLRRILTSQNWEGHPLRKDYVVQEVFNGMVVNPPEKMNIPEQQFGVRNNANSMSNKNPMGM
jgi:NADH-quinone oxidoreductase subunit C